MLCRAGASSWLYDLPWGLREVLNYINKEYNNPPVLITENGMSDDSGTVEDDHRIKFYNNYINNVLKGNTC